MSKIPYQFETPIPSYFRKNGWLKPDKKGSHHKTATFLLWCFSKCNSHPRKIVFDSNELLLDSFEFICGRNTAAQETGLTEKEVRGRLTAYEKAGILKKTANSRANRYTCYKWSTEVFCENEVQLEGQLRANSGPTEGHKLEYRNKKKERKLASDSSLGDRPSQNATLSEGTSDNARFVQKIFFHRETSQFVGITQEDHDAWQKVFPHLNLGIEFLEMRTWLMSPKGKKRQGTRSFIDKWLKQSEANRMSTPPKIIDYKPNNEDGYVLKEEDIDPKLKEFANAREY